MSIESKYVASINLARWVDMVGQRNQNTNIVVLDDHGILYGHQLARDLAAGRKDAQDVKFFRGVIFDAFLALLTVKFPEHEYVQALRDCDEVTPELLEGVSAELVLTADDLELVVEAQERVASERA